MERCQNGKGVRDNFGPDSFEGKGVRDKFWPDNFGL